MSKSNHFYHTYVGNKRNEIKYFEQYLLIDKDTIFIEPFAGSAAVSFYLWAHNKCDNIHINDRDPMLKQIHDVMSDDIKRNDLINTLQLKVNNITNKSEYNTETKGDDMISHIIANTYYVYRFGIYPMNKPKPDYSKKFNISYNDFLKSPTVTKSYDDFKVICDKYKHDPNAFIFLDPPYVNEDNTYYHNDGSIFDMESMYQYIADLMKCPAKVLMIVSNTLLSRLLYKDYIRGSYDKFYSLSKKRTTHLIISNYII